MSFGLRPVVGLGAMRFNGVQTVAELAAQDKLALWLSTSDLTSLYLDDQAVGGNASADAETVGLVLDKAQMGGKTADAFIEAQPELVTNGTFDADSDWTKGANWTIGSGVASKTSGAANSVSQDIGMTVGTVYAVTVAVSSYTSGTLTPYAGSTGAGTAISAAGTTTQIIECAGDSSVYFFGSSSFIGSIDDISVKALPGLHFTQSDTAKEPRYKVRTNNGKTYGVLYSEGVDELLTGEPFAYDQGGMVMVFGVEGAAQSGNYVYGEGNTSHSVPVYGVSTGLVDTSKLRLYVRNSANTTLLEVESTIDVFDGDPHVCTVIDTGSGYEFYVDRAAAGSGSYARSGVLSLNASTLFALRYPTEVLHFAGDLVGPIFADPNDVSDANIRVMEQYIANIMGVTLS